MILLYFSAKSSSCLGSAFKLAKKSRLRTPHQRVLFLRVPETWRPTAPPASGHIRDNTIKQAPIIDVSFEGNHITELYLLVYPEREAGS